MQSGRNKLANMTKEERHEYLDGYRQLTDEQRLAKISEGTRYFSRKITRNFQYF